MYSGTVSVRRNMAFCEREAGGEAFYIACSIKIGDPSPSMQWNA